MGIVDQQKDLPVDVRQTLDHGGEFGVGRDEPRSVAVGRQALLKFRDALAEGRDDVADDVADMTVERQPGRQLAAFRQARLPLLQKGAFSESRWRLNQSQAFLGNLADMPEKPRPGRQSGPRYAAATAPDLRLNRNLAGHYSRNFHGQLLLHENQK